MMEPQDLINWKQLSLHVAGNDNSVRRKRIPVKYEPEIKSLLTMLRNWMRGPKP